MTGRLAVAILAAAGGVAIASLVPQIPQTVRYAVERIAGAQTLRPTETQSGAKPKGSADAEVHEEHATIRLADDQIETAGIELAAVQDGTLTRRIVVPGTIVPHADRIARVSVKLSATVTELRKKLGDPVTRGEVIAVLESREVANAKSEYLAARLNSDLQKNLYVHAAVAIEERVLALAVPASAVQTIDKIRVLFVRTPEGFEKRQVMLGDGDDRLFEVLSGVSKSETIAVTNTFALKAEFLKSLAED
jgi:multidrug efflux pump subunit AcrA (membrane-fusion protein)